MILVTAHPRSGTGFAANTLQTAGLDVGHERLGKDGISSWMWAANDRNVPFGDGYRDIKPDRVCHLIRKPIDCIASVAFTEHHSLPFRCKHVRISPNTIDPIIHAIDSIYGWLKLTDYPRVKTENFAEFCRHKWRLDVSDLPPANIRHHPEISEEMLSEYPLYQELKEAYEQAY